MTHGRADVEALLDTWSLRPSRALGQNFVADANTVRRIVRLAGVGPADPVVEVGAGLGSLTLALVDTGAQIVAVEVDRHLLAPLRAVVEPRGVAVHGGDATVLDFAALTAGRPCVVVANLPYNVATPLVLRLLETQPVVRRLFVMVQREVGERWVAAPGDAAYGGVSLRVSYFADAHLAGRVPATVFLPRPRVESVLVALERRAAVRIDPARVSEEDLFDVVRRAFAHRRKMLRRSLADWSDPAVFDRAGVDPTARPEQLGLEEFARLASAR